MNAPHGLKRYSDDSDLNTKAIKKARTGESSTTNEMDLEHDMSFNHIIYLGLQNLSWGSTIPRVIDPENTPSGQFNNFQKVVEILVEEFNYHGDSIEIRELINKSLKFSRSCNEIAGKCHAICKKSFEHLNFTFICFKENNFLSFDQKEMQLLIDNSTYFNKLKAFYSGIDKFLNNTTDLLDIEVSDFEQVTSSALDLSQQNFGIPQKINFNAFNVVSYPQMNICDIEKWAEEHNKENDIEPALPSVLRLGIVSNYLGFEKYNENSCSIIGDYVPNLSITAKLSLYAYLMGNDGVVYVNEGLRSIFAESFGKDLIKSTKKKRGIVSIATADLIDSFVGCQIPNISMTAMEIPKLFNNFSTLTKLEIVRPNVTKRNKIHQIDFKSLRGLNLKSLTLKLNHYDEIERENIQNLKGMKIEYLDVSYFKTYNRIFNCNKYLSTICEFPLKTLKLENITGFSDGMLKEIGKISTLTVLKITSSSNLSVLESIPSITNVGLEALATCPLEYLELEFLKKSDKDSSFLKSFKHLKGFKFNFINAHFSINDESISNFSHLPLTQLTINTDDRVNKDMLLRVSKISTLKDLKVHFTIVKKKILPTLSDITQLPPNGWGMAVQGMNAMLQPNPQFFMNMRPQMMGPMNEVPMYISPIMQSNDYDLKIITFKSPKEVSSFVTKCMKDVSTTNNDILETDFLQYLPESNLEDPKPKNENAQYMDIETEVMPF